MSDRIPSDCGNYPEDWDYDKKLKRSVKVLTIIIAVIVVASLIGICVALL